MLRLAPLGMVARTSRLLEYCKLLTGPALHSMQHAGWQDKTLTNQTTTKVLLFIPDSKEKFGENKETCNLLLWAF